MDALEYEIVRSHWAGGLVEEVAKRIAEGWDPLGGPFIQPKYQYESLENGRLCSNDAAFFQAMTRKRKHD